MEFMIGVVVGASIFAVVIAISMAKAAKEIDETESLILAREAKRDDET